MLNGVNSCNMATFENLDIAAENARLATSDIEREILGKLYQYSHDNHIPEFDAVIIWSDNISVHIEVSYLDYKPAQVVQEEILHLDDRIEEVNTVRNYSEDVIGALAERLIIDDSVKINIGQKEITFHDYFYNLLRHQNFAC